MCCSCSAYLNIHSDEEVAEEDFLLAMRFANAHAKTCGYITEYGGADDDPAWRTYGVGPPQQG